MAIAEPGANSGLQAALDITEKGFTEHEHVDHANVIHMGGRIYDPFLGRFMQADPLVQAPENGQSFNRYSYVFNNPLSYTDPSGYAASHEGKCHVNSWAPFSGCYGDNGTFELQDVEKVQIAQQETNQYDTAQNSDSSKSKGTSSSSVGAGTYIATYGYFEADLPKRKQIIADASHGYDGSKENEGHTLSVQTETQGIDLTFKAFGRKFGLETKVSSGFSWKSTVTNGDFMESKSEVSGSLQWGVGEFTVKRDFNKTELNLTDNSTSSDLGLGPLTFQAGALGLNLEVNSKGYKAFAETEYLERENKDGSVTKVKGEGFIDNSGGNLIHKWGGAWHKKWARTTNGRTDKGLQKPLTHWFISH